MNARHDTPLTTNLRIDLVGDLDASMSTHLSDTLDVMAEKNSALVTISLRRVRKTCWSAVCAFAKIVRESREKGMDVRVADAAPRIALLLHANGLPFA